MLFKAIPNHLADMALFSVNTCCRDSQVCNLQWSWKVDVPQLDTAVFIIPGEQVKNGDDRLVVLNKTAFDTVKQKTGNHLSQVFTFHGKQITRMLNTAWLRAGKSVGLQQVRVHDLKHTYGRRLRSAGVSFEDRQDLLGHRSGRTTAHYSAAELSRPLEAANTICKAEGENQQPEIVVLRRLNTS